MKSRILICLISIEFALALYFAIGAAVAYSQVLPMTTILSAGNSSKPITNYSGSKIISTTITIRGLASWYSRKSSGPMTASGQPMNDSAMACAVWIERDGKVMKPDMRLFRVTAISTGKSILVSWKDNGPSEKNRREGVIIDLTPRAMKELAGNDGIKAGRIRVKVEGITTL